MKPSKSHPVTLVQERTFLVAVIFQAGVALTSLLIAISIWQSIHGRALVSSVRSTFSLYEPGITEAVYVQEVSNQTPTTRLKPIQDFEVQLRLHDIDAKISLNSCGNGKGDVILPLFVGDRKLLTCVYVKVGNLADGKTVWILMGSSLLSFLLSWLLWLGVRQRIANRVVQPMLEEIADKARMMAVAELATQVLHDIRSPLAALAVVEQELENPSQETKKLASAAIRQIQAIARTLLDKNRSEGLRSVQVTDTLDAVVSEMRLRFSGDCGLKIIWNPSFEVRKIRLNVQPVELIRVLSNLITNSVEACDGQDKIVEIFITIESTRRVAIAIKDNGRGISAEHLKVLGTQNFSTGKLDGNGLGLSHAFAAVSRWQGELRIKSNPGHGTEVTLSLPSAPTS